MSDLHIRCILCVRIQVMCWFFTSSPHDFAQLVSVRLPFTISPTTEGCRLCSCLSNHTTSRLVHSTKPCIRTVFMSDELVNTSARHVSECSIRLIRSNRKLCPESNFKEIKAITAFSTEFESYRNSKAYSKYIPT